jgi:uncharacterized protein (TIGR00661 family)
MARIVYGVSGEGSGHSSRARVVAAHLEARGHRVTIVSYGRGYENLHDRFDVFQTEGLHIATRDNEVSKRRTFLDNLQRLPQGHRKLNAIKKDLFQDDPPEVVLTDFEPMTAYLAHHYDRPLVTIDNQHRLRYMTYPCPADLKADQLLTENIIRAMVPRPDVSLVTTFYFGETRNDRTFLFPPLLRDEVMDLVPAEEGHVLVYLTSGFSSFLDSLRTFKRERFVVYGCGPDREEGHLHFKAPSREGFLQDLAGCKAVMATAGYTLITEALHLHKPYLALPMRGQFEQEINAFFLEQSGYGRNLRQATPEGIGDFLYGLPEYKARLSEYPGSDNTALLGMLDQLLENEGELARAFHQRRTA